MKTVKKYQQVEECQNYISVVCYFKLEMIDSINWLEYFYKLDKELTFANIIQAQYMNTGNKLTVIFFSVFCQYLSGILIDILHHQVEPVTITTLVKNLHGNMISTDVLQYMESLLQPQKVNLTLLMYLKTQEIGQRDNFAYHWTLKMCDDLDKTTLLKSRSANLFLKKN